MTPAGVRDPTPETPPTANGAGPRAPWAYRPRVASAVWPVAATVAGSLPVLWVLGAVPWRLPTLLVEKMFRSFVACASDGGALNPIRMLCPAAGVPLGMYQTDGGLTYPFGGVLVRAGVDPVVAWQSSVAVVVIAGTGVLCWLLLRLTGSPVVATCFVVVHGLSGTASARSWDWYWRVTGAALLPLVFAAAYVLYARAPQRRLRPLLLPGLALFAGVLVVSIEWQYAGLFAAGTATAAMLLITLQNGWRWRQRLALTASTAAGLGVLVALLRWRLAIAGITAQMDNALAKATEGSVDLVSFVVPDGPMSLTGRLLTALGQDDRLVRSMVEHKQLWVAPYVGVLVVLFFVAVLALRRLRIPPDPGRPRGFLVLVSLIAVASVVLALGPVIHLAGLIHPSAAVDSPVGLLYAGTPVQWIRFPRTFGYLLHLSLLLIYASLTAALLRDRARRWSPLIVVLVVLLTADFVSPQVLNAVNDPQPSIALAPEWNRIDSNDPAAVRFAARQQPVFEEALRGVDGPVVMLPWGNAWSIASMGPDVGIPVRNVGIDRNLVQVVAASPYSATELERPTVDTMRRMLDSGWASAVVLLDHTPHGTSITRYDSGRFTTGDLARQAWRRRHEWRLARDGHCVDSYTWFSVIAPCDDGTTVQGPASRDRLALPSGPVPPASVIERHPRT